MPATVQRSPAFNGRTGQRAASLVAADGRAACCTTRHPQVLWLNLAMMAGQCRLPSRRSRKYSWSCRRLIELELSASYCHALMDLFNMQVVRPVY